MWTKNQLLRFVLQIFGFALLALTLIFAYEIGLSILFLSVPLAIFIAVINWMFNKTLKISVEQVTQTSRHVEELSHYIQEQEKTAKILQKSEEQFRNAFDYASIGMALVSPTGTLLKVNRALCEITGFTDRELLQKKFQSLIFEDDIEQYNLSLSKLLDKSLHSAQSEKRAYHKNQNVLWLMWSASLVQDEANDLSHFIFQIQNITDRKNAETRLIHDALHDSLTDLPNRVLFLDRLKVAFKRAKRHFDSQFAVLYLDFDRFKLVNDSFGHLIGDKLLVEIAERLRSVLRASDTVARLGGDEFTMLVEEIAHPDEAKEVAERIRKEMRKPFKLNGQEFFATVSIGIAGWSRNYERPEFILRDADTALYQAKRMGRDRYEVFDPKMHEKALQFLQIETDLRLAIQRSEFFLVYQPIVDLTSNKLSGFEALIRWQHPTLGLISPINFISVAEEIGLIVPIGEWVLREACRQLHVWQEKFSDYSNLWISVNVSTRQFTQIDIAALVAETLSETKLAPQCLKLEVTESAMVEDIEFAVSVMEKLNQLGVRLSIDDFGTGYSSLSYLHRLPLSSLKIDRSFVKQMEESSENQEIIKTILTLAQSLQLETIAEGIESPEQLSQLQSLDCAFGQGFYFAKPLETADVEKLLDEKFTGATTKDSENKIAA